MNIDKQIGPITIELENGFDIEQFHDLLMTCCEDIDTCERAQSWSKQKREHINDLWNDLVAATNGL